jgi:hypothetical protein
MKAGLETCYLLNTHSTKRLNLRRWRDAYKAQSTGAARTIPRLNPPSYLYNFQVAVNAYKIHKSLAILWLTTYLSTIKPI